MVAVAVAVAVVVGVFSVSQNGGQAAHASFLQRYIQLNTHLSFFFV